MKIQRIPIKRIKPARYNPRVDLQPGDPEYEKLRHSMETFGCVEPLVWNRRTGHLVGGHQRFKILVEHGATEIDVSVVELEPTQEQALNIALNKITGDWDERKLAELLDGLATIPEFDVALTGFDKIEIDQLLDRLDGQGEDDFDLADAIDAAKDRPAVTQCGELIELGPHRLLCGDSAKPEDIQRLLDGQPADLLVTDPPYNVNYYGGNRPNPKGARPKPSRQWKRIYHDDLTQEQYEHWLGGILRSALEMLAPGAPFYIWNGHRQFGPMHAVLTSAGAHVACVITWAKECFAIGYGDYNQQTEFCLYGWKATAKNACAKPSGADPKRGTAHRWYGPTNESSLWQIHRDRTREYRHPTQKPLALPERAVRNSSQRGDLVLELFGGSGSTLIAAERLGRRCCAIEIDPRYCDAIVRRYLAAVGPARTIEPLAQRYRVVEQGVTA